MFEDQKPSLQKPDAVVHVFCSGCNHAFWDHLETGCRNAWCHCEGFSYHIHDDPNLEPGKE